MGVVLLAWGMLTVAVSGSGSGSSSSAVVASSSSGSSDCETAWTTYYASDTTMQACVAAYSTYNQTQTVTEDLCTYCEEMDYSGLDETCVITEEDGSSSNQTYYQEFEDIKNAAENLCASSSSGSSAEGSESSSDTSGESSSESSSGSSSESGSNAAISPFSRQSLFMGVAAVVVSAIVF